MTYILTPTRLATPRIKKTPLRPGTATSISYSIRLNSEAEEKAARAVGAVRDLADDLIQSWRFTPEQRADFFAMGVAA